MLWSLNITEIQSQEYAFIILSTIICTGQCSVTSTPGTAAMPLELMVDEGRKRIIVFSLFFFLLSTVFRLVLFAHVYRNLQIVVFNSIFASFISYLVRFSSFEAIWFVRKGFVKWFGTYATCHPQHVEELMIVISLVTVSAVD